MSSIIKGLNEARSDWDSNMPGYQGDYGGEANWDSGKRAFKRQEAEQEWEHEQAYARKLQQQEAGTWYIRINGKIFKDRATGEPIEFNGKKHANAVAVKMMQKDFNKGKEFMLTTKPVDVTPKQVNELSPQTLASYKKKAGADATASDKAGDFKRGDKRMSGIMKATKKEFDNDSKNVKEGSMGTAVSQPPGSTVSAGQRFYKPRHVPNQDELQKQGMDEEKERLDPKCWTGYKKQGTKMKGGVRVNNCVPIEESAIMKGLKS